MDELVLGKRNGKGTPGEPGATATGSRVEGSSAEGRGGPGQVCFKVGAVIYGSQRCHQDEKRPVSVKKRSKEEQRQCGGDGREEAERTARSEEQLRWGKQARGRVAMAGAGGPSEPLRSGSAGLGSARLGRGTNNVPRFPAVFKVSLMPAGSALHTCPVPHLPGTPSPPLEEEGSGSQQF